MVPWALALACVSAPARDVDRYAAVVGDRDVGLTEGTTACGAVVDGDLRGDCMLHVAAVEAGRAGGRPQDACPAVPAGTWQDECWFLAAETLRARGRDQSAAALCLQAGTFKDDCAQHLWQTVLHTLATRRGPVAVAEVLPAARKVHDHWAPLLSESTDFEQRFWARLYGNLFEGHGRIDLSICDELSGDPAVPDAAAQAARCVDAGREVYLRELAPRLEGSGVDLCSEPAPRSADLLPWLAARPDPRLDSVIDARRAQLCREP